MSATETNAPPSEAGASIVLDFSLSVRDAQAFHHFVRYKRTTRFELIFRIATAVLQTLVVVSAVISIRISYDLAWASQASSIGSPAIIAILWLLVLALAAIIYCARGIYNRSVVDGYQTTRRHHLEFGQETITSKSDDGLYQTTYSACEIIRSGNNIFLMWTRLRGTLIQASAITPAQIETILLRQSQTKVNAKS